MDELLQLFVSSSGVSVASPSSADEPAFDRLSVLPRDILVNMLSLLTAKEATATCVLSRSWKYLWVFATSAKMDFDGTDALGKLQNLRECLGRHVSSVWKALEEERYKFITRVERITMFNQMLGLRSDVGEFRVYFDLNEHHSPWVDKWLSYALSRNIKKLELIFIDVLGSRDLYDHAYSFPYKNGKFPPNFKLLKHMSFRLVNVSNKDVRLILEKCTLLEHLSLHGSHALTSLEIVGTYPSFKSLEISCCCEIQSVVFRDCGIVTLKYKGRGGIPFVFDNVPNLTRLWTYKDFTPLAESLIPMFSPLFPQLEMFKFYFTCDFAHKYQSECRDWFSAPNLKQLVLCLGPNWKDMKSLLPFVKLIHKAPCLQRFVVEVTDGATQPELFHGPCHESDDYNDIINARMLVTGNIEQLKEVEFVGYRGTFRQLQLIKHLVDNSVALQNLIVDTRTCFDISKQFPWDRIPLHKARREMFERRKYAEKQFQGHVPSTINLKIL